MGRSQEAPLLLDAGFEVLPSLGSQARLRYDSGFDVEHGYFDTDWAAFSTMPVNVSRRLREVNLESQQGRVSPEDAELLNAWTDMVWLLGVPSWIAEVQRWYRGRIVCRVAGYPPDGTNFSAQLRAAGVHWDSRMIYAPTAYPLLGEEPDVRASAFLFHCTVDDDRLPFRWAGGASRPVAATVIPYLSTSPLLREWRDQVLAAVGHLGAEVLGKNDKGSPHAAHPAVVGALPELEFFRRIATARVFVEWNPIAWHQRFTPVEAAFMGVPVLFLSSSSLARTAAVLLPEHDLASLGGFPDGPAMARWLDAHFDDFAALAGLVERQRPLFRLSYGRAKVLADTIAWRERLEAEAAVRDDPAPPPPRRAPARRYPRFFQRDFPMTVGALVGFGPESFIRQSGDLRGDDAATLTFSRGEGPGYAVAEHLPDGVFGVWRMTIRYRTDGPEEAHVADFAAALSGRALVASAYLPGGDGERSVFIDAAFPEDTRDLDKEISLGWRGDYAFAFLGMTVERLA